MPVNNYMNFSLPGNLQKINQAFDKNSFATLGKKAEAFFKENKNPNIQKFLEFIKKNGLTDINSKASKNKIRKKEPNVSVGSASLEARLRQKLSTNTDKENQNNKTENTSDKAGIKSERNEATGNKPATQENANVKTATFKVSSTTKKINAYFSQEKQNPAIAKSAKYFVQAKNLKLSIEAGMHAAIAKATGFLADSGFTTSVNGMRNSHERARFNALFKKNTNSAALKGNLDSELKNQKEKFEKLQSKQKSRAEFFRPTVNQSNPQTNFSARPNPAGQQWQGTYQAYGTHAYPFKNMFDNIFSEFNQVFHSAFGARPNPTGQQWQYTHQGYAHQGYAHQGYAHQGYAHQGYAHQGYGQYADQGYRPQQRPTGQQSTGAQSRPQSAQTSGVKPQYPKPVAYTGSKISLIHPNAVQRDQELKRAHLPELGRFPNRLLLEEDLEIGAVKKDMENYWNQSKTTFTESQLQSTAEAELGIRKKLYANRRAAEESINFKYGNEPKLASEDLKKMGAALQNHLDKKQIAELKADILAVLKHSTEKTSAAFDQKYQHMFGQSITDSNVNKMFARFAQFGLSEYQTMGETSEFWKKDGTSASRPSSPPRKEEVASHKPSESSGSGKKLSIYDKPTREPGDGFDESAMFAQFHKLPVAKALSEQMAKQGFQYAGHTGSDSKANTDIKLKEIRINKELSPEMAALSLAYELKNASQADEFKKTLELLDRKDKTPELANAYAEGILRKEAKSVLIRSQMAVAMNREDLVKNQRYNEIAKDGSLSDSQKEAAIFKEMKQNGTVHQGKKKAFDHYVEQFWTHKKIMSKL